MSLRAQRPGSATAFGVAAVLVVAMAPRQPRSAIPPRDPGGGCQEYSGGDTRCPGG